MNNQRCGTCRYRLNGACVWLTERIGFGNVPIWLYVENVPVSADDGSDCQVWTESDEQDRAA